ncbi:hypothetical protein GRO01_13260 [Gluconobacter roseus NBRC 3990]|uniref:Uncharacterized protein n=1 Tax=Gluconobacter roseus NBRC 3990 TaxID=1307950 RepID=A0A4Y3M377_9PROT|nr:hypothetical protein AA3990_0217 [Gluconobacter roseus NBRC 3990]GEB03750.1 hypothetical protein GRO01_13260 [Gluconobacter roseus NBRC 3990]GLP94205.1 hypothetical protein GCM10007871_21830 [Gluconobacter roseus NBRC 3990]
MIQIKMNQAEDGTPGKLACLLDELMQNVEAFLAIRQGRFSKISRFGCNLTCDVMQCTLSGRVKTCSCRIAGDQELVRPTVMMGRNRTSEK